MFIRSLVFVALSLFATASHSATIAIANFDPGAGFGSGLSVNVTGGFHFSTNQDLFVQELGFFDRLGNGLGRSYSMGIVNSSSVVLGTATIPSGTDGRFEDLGIAIGINAGSGWRFQALDGGPLQLFAGINYAVVVTMFPGQTDEIMFPIAFTPDPAINFMGTFAACCSNPQAGTLHYPTQFATSEFNVNFTFTDSAVVPLPAALPLYGAGLALLGWLGSRRRKLA